MTPEDVKKAHKIINTLDHLINVRNDIVRCGKARLIIDVSGNGIKKTHDIPFADSDLINFIVGKVDKLKDELGELGVVYEQ